MLPEEMEGLDLRRNGATHHVLLHFVKHLHVSWSSIHNNEKEFHWAKSMLTPLITHTYSAKD
jgi:hypothetical protein